MLNHKQMDYVTEHFVEGRVWTKGLFDIYYYSDVLCECCKKEQNKVFSFVTGKKTRVKYCLSCIKIFFNPSDSDSMRVKKCREKAKSVGLFSQEYDFYAPSPTLKGIAKEIVDFVATLRYGGILSECNDSADFLFSSKKSKADEAFAHILPCLYLVSKFNAQGNLFTHKTKGVIPVNTAFLAKCDVALAEDRIMFSFNSYVFTDNDMREFLIHLNSYIINFSPVQPKYSIVS